MKALCKRTYFTSENNKPVFEKNEYYYIVDRTDYTISILSGNKTFYLNKNTFNKHFIDIKELRENKINEILNR
jgi:hypothetical protein